MNANADRINELATLVIGCGEYAIDLLKEDAVLVEPFAFICVICG
jgi:hypothetical protein